MTPQVVLCDADNTLWDTDAVFAAAQERVLDWVELRIGKRCESEDRLGFVRRYDQAIATRHHLHLRYPPILLVRSLAEGLHGCAPESAAALVISGLHPSNSIVVSDAETIVTDYLDLLTAVPRLLPRVKEGLSLARESHLALFVLTEGRVEKQQRIIKTHHLSSYFEAVFEIPKNVASFERFRERFAATRVTIIGDQPDRDIEPARQAGLRAVLVPSRFRPSWNSVDSALQATYVANDFCAAIEWILKEQRLPDA